MNAIDTAIIAFLFSLWTFVSQAKAGYRLRKLEDQLRDLQFNFGVTKRDVEWLRGGSRLGKSSGS